MGFLTALLTRCMRRRGSIGVALLAGLWVAPAAMAQGPRVTERQVQAVFLFHFAQFVEWPSQAFPDAQAPLCIGILGEDPFGPFLDETVKGEKVDGRPLEVRRLRTLEDLDSCHILFIGKSETPRMTRILEGLKDHAVLTVGDGDAFARHGGMIQFGTEAGKVRLFVNINAAKAANLTISSKLLRSAEIVTTRNQ